MSDWTPGSWRSHEIRQQPDYPDPAALAAAEAELASYPSLVSPADTDALTAALAEAQAGRAFLLQGGDCAESFAEFSPATIDAGYALLTQMAATIAAAAGLPVIRLARTAGQFAKPRSTLTERRGDVALPAYRGDIVNGIGFDPAERAPDPARMFRAYAQSYATLSRLRALAAGAPFHTSHEALLLSYEQPLVRAAGDAHYATSGHFLWIGDRTRFPGSAHVEFARGIANPIGIKCGPELEPDTLRTLLDTLNPARAAGRITLISRMGSGAVAARLPALVRAAAAEGHRALWSCDPMHGNTVSAANGYKTRRFADIQAETEAFFAIVHAEGQRPGGVHVEMTGQNVAECTGGADEVTEGDLGERYRTHCDPRLNPGQAMEFAQRVAATLAATRRSEAA